MEIGLNDHLFGKELFIRFSASVFRKLPSIYVFSYFPFGFDGRMWDLIVSVPDHCLPFYFLQLHGLIMLILSRFTEYNYCTVLERTIRMQQTLINFKTHQFQGS